MDVPNRFPNQHPWNPEYATHAEAPMDPKPNRQSQPNPTTARRGFIGTASIEERHQHLEGIEQKKGSMPVRSHSRDQQAHDYKHHPCEPENFACWSKDRCGRAEGPRSTYEPSTVRSPWGPSRSSIVSGNHQETKQWHFEMPAGEVPWNKHRGCDPQVLGGRHYSF